MGGQACCAVKHGSNSLVTGTPDYDIRPPGITRTRSSVRMLICALDYKHTNHPLTSTRDGENVRAMASTCGVQDLTVMYNEDCTKTAVKTEIRKIGRRCQENDVFVFYYSGHGTEVKDEDGDEEDGFDEAFCFVTHHGHVHRSSLMTDDEFVEIVTSAIPKLTNVIVIADCCHSGTIVDLKKDSWADRCAVAMVGCSDQQESADIGIGGLFTHSMLLAMEKLSENDHYSIGKLYNTAVKENDRIFHGAQTLTLQCSSSTYPNQQAWPFVPRTRYESPLRSAKNKAIMQSYAPAGTRGIDIGSYKDVPDDLAAWAKENDIDLGSDYEDEELENGWKPGKALLDSMGL